MIDLTNTMDNNNWITSFFLLFCCMLYVIHVLHMLMSPFAVIPCDPIEQLRDFNSETYVEIFTTTANNIPDASIYVYGSTAHAYCHKGTEEYESGYSSLDDGRDEMVATCTSVGEWSRAFSSCTGN